MFSSIREKLTGENGEEDSRQMDEAEMIDEVREEIENEGEEAKIRQSLASVEELENAIEEEFSKNPGAHDQEKEDVEQEIEDIQENRDEIQGSMDISEKPESHREDGPENKDDKNNQRGSSGQSKKLHRPSLPGPENSPVDLKSQLQNFEQKIVSEESRELAKINDLEQRVERMELDSTESLEDRISRLEQKIESMQSVEKFNNRLQELEEVVAESEAGKVDELEKKVEELWEAMDEESKAFEEIDQKEDRRIRLLWQAVDFKIEELQDQLDQESQDDVEELWEAMDEELMEVESQINDNRDEIQDLYSIVLELSELVKQQIQEKNH